MEKHKRLAIPVFFQQVADGHAVRNEVSRILSSPEFQRSERLRRLADPLTFVAVHVCYPCPAGGGYRDEGQYETRSPL